MAEKLIFVYGRLYFYLKLQHPSRVFEALKFLPFPCSYLRAKTVFKCSTSLLDSMISFFFKVQ